MSDSETVKTDNSDDGSHVTMRNAVHKKPVSTPRHDISDGSKHVGLKVPPFSPEDPEIWFALLEGQFHNYSIRDDHMKFTQVITNLDLHHAKAVKDIIINPPTNNKYDKIKTELIRRLSASHEKKVKQLLTHEELGDRKPSQFLRHLQDLAGPSVPEEFIRSIWSNRLPHEIQTVLASQPTHSLEQLSDLADRIQELTSPYNVASTSSAVPQGYNPTSEIAELKKMVEKLALKLDEHTRTSYRFNNRAKQRRHRSPSRSRQRTRSKSSHRRYPICWYHSRFGSNATKCEKPCDYEKAGNAQGSR